MLELVRDHLGLSPIERDSLELQITRLTSTDIFFIEAEFKEGYQNTRLPDLTDLAARVFCLYRSEVKKEHKDKVMKFIYEMKEKRGTVCPN